MDGKPARPRHRFDSLERFHGPEKHSTRDSIGETGNIQAVVISIDEINIGVTGRAKQDGIAAGEAGEGMSRGVSRSQVSLDLHDARREKILAVAADENLPQQFPADTARIAIVKVSRERSRLGARAGTFAILPL